ncbi:hypothetical protein DPMN_129985 [Dreissena polymorpha]|uniref:Uncharacterized protein n=1 Tax=Dreissena polymorpha TaxID=45954 RepID=A0A9D4JXY6_DREPO|nr:hypothetical protein DPMN_129985 [Dreissena polymorpha]
MIQLQNYVVTKASGRNEVKTILAVAGPNLHLIPTKKSAAEERLLSHYVAQIHSVAI